jgi:hypothetical protein
MPQSASTDLCVIVVRDNYVTPRFAPSVTFPFAPELILFREVSKSGVLALDNIQQRPRHPVLGGFVVLVRVRQRDPVREILRGHLLCLSSC